MATAALAQYMNRHMLAVATTTKQCMHYDASIYINLYQFISFCIKVYQFLSISFFRWQRLSFPINRYQFVSISIKLYQMLSFCIKAYHFVSNGNTFNARKVAVPRSVLHQPSQLPFLLLAPLVGFGLSLGFSFGFLLAFLCYFFLYACHLGAVILW